MIEDLLTVIDRQNGICRHDFAYQYGASSIVVREGKQVEVMRERYHCRRCLHIEDRDNPPLAMPT